MEENSLDSLMGSEQNPNDLAVFQDNPRVGLQLPTASIRNRAAVTSLLSDNPDQAIENFQLMVAENEQGSDVITKEIQNKAVSV